MNYVTIKDLSVSYGDHEVLSGVELDVRSDDFIGVIGPNGGGKTTLVKAIMGLVPYCGTITYADELMRSGRPRIGYLPQVNDTDGSFPISVGEVVLSGLQGQAGGLCKYIRNRGKATKIMKKVGIAEIAKRPVGELSGGQMQRTLLCRALISEPRLLILDEPANFVDNAFEKELYELLHELNEREKVAIIMVSHDLGTITSVVKSIVCVNRNVHRHDSNIITREQLQNYNCPIQLVSHGDVPHTVLRKH